MNVFFWESGMITDWLVIDYNWYGGASRLLVTEAGKSSERILTCDEREA